MRICSALIPMVRLAVPPLRERIEDLAAISERVLQRIAHDAGVSPPGVVTMRSRFAPCRSASRQENSGIAPAGTTVSPTSLSFR